MYCCFHPCLINESVAFCVIFQFTISCSDNFQANTLMMLWPCFKTIRIANNVTINVGETWFKKYGMIRKPNLSNFWGFKNIVQPEKNQFNNQKDWTALINRQWPNFWLRSVHGTALGPPWDHPGTTLGLPWNRPGTTLGLPWDRLPRPWDCLGMTLGPHWDNWNKNRIWNNNYLMSLQGWLR